MKRILIATIAAAMAATPALAEDSAVPGSWDTVAKTDFGEFKATMTVSEGEEGYSVEFADVPPEGAPAGPPMESTISDVMVDGNEFSFKRSLTTPQGPMELSYSGSVDGDTLTGEASSSFGAIPISGTRVTE